MLKSGNTSIFNTEENKNYLGDKKSKAVQKFGRKGKQQVAFYQLCKEYTKLSQTEEGQLDPRVKFYEECVKDNQLVMPIL